MPAPTQISDLLPLEMMGKDKLQPQKVSTSEPEDKSHNAVIDGKKLTMTEAEIEKFWKWQLIRSMQEVSPDFVVDERNRGILGEMYLYVWNKGSKLDTRKGILFWGEVGTGKTTLIKGLQRYLAIVNSLGYGSNNRDICIEIRSAAEISLRYASEGMDVLSRWTDRECAGHLAIDEIGREEIAKHFGTTCNVIQTLLQLRYEQRHIIRTFGTTNLDMAHPDEFRERYGDYILDRVKEMFNVVYIGGGSRRHN